ncbi:hypothetical protein EDD22DRAFT_959589 [Suillus occidentalis]|nr:hypothetical protein EDD22DRAFT_959589 [Suillus occidentalis]
MNTTTFACDEHQFEHPTAAALSCSSNEVRPCEQSSPPPSSPSQSPGLSESGTTTSGSDAEDILPATPDSKHSYRTSRVAAPPRGLPTLRHCRKPHNLGSHPYLQPSSSFEEEHLGHKILGGPVNDDESSEPLSLKAQDAYLRQIEQLTPDSFRCAVHYKEAVRERKRMRMFTAAWEIEEVKRLRTFLQTTMANSEMDFMAVEEESNWLLDMIVDRQKLRSVRTDPRHVASTYDRDKKCVRRADAELSFLKDNVTQRLSPSIIRKPNLSDEYDWQQTDLYFNDDELYLNNLFDDEPNSSDNPSHRYTRLHSDTSYSELLQSSGQGTSESGQILNARESVVETHPPHFPTPQYILHAHHQSHNRDASAIQQPSNLTIDNPVTTLHITASRQLEAPAHHLSDGQYRDVRQVHDPCNHDRGPVYPGEGSEIRDISPLPQDYHLQDLPPDNNSAFNPSSIGNFLTEYGPPINLSGTPYRLMSTKVVEHRREVTDFYITHTPAERIMRRVRQPQKFVSEPPKITSQLLPIYNANDSLHEKIVQCALDHTIDHAVNVHSLLRQKERKQLVDQALTMAVQSTCPDTPAKTQKKWVKKNKKALYQTVSEPFKKVMINCKRIARAKIQTGYSLRPEPWSSIPETKHQKDTVLDLISDKIFPPKFSAGDDGRTLENRVVWDVILNSLQEAGYQKYLKTLKNMIPTAIVAVRCALSELSTGKFVNVEFEADAFRSEFDGLQTHISSEVSMNTEFSNRWRSYEEMTLARLLNI